MHMSEETQRNLVYEAEVSTEGAGSRRWSETVETVVRAEDDKFYRILWERGLTENQEDTFYEGEVPEVFPSEGLQVAVTRLYLTAEEQAQVHPTLAQRFQEEAASYELATGTPMAAHLPQGLQELLEKLQPLLPALEALDLAGASGGYRKATAQYVAALLTLTEGPPA